MKTHQTEVMSSVGNDVDKGWAWLVLLAVYSGILILSTSLYTSGVIYVELLAFYRQDATKTSVIGSLNSGLLSLLGPLVAILINKFSCRSTMFTGGLLLCLSYLCSAFVNSLDFLIVFVGIIGGIGNAMVSTPFVVILAYYFDKRRHFIISLSNVVIGVGMFVASPLALFLLDTYGIKGTFMINSAICAQLCVCAVICRPSSKELHIRKERALQEKSHRKKHNHDNIHDANLNPVHRQARRFTYAFTFTFDLLKNVPLLAFLASTMTWNFMLSICLMHLPNYIVSQGLSVDNITIVVTIFSICNTSGRFLGALSVNQRIIDSLPIQVFVMAVGGGMTITFPLYSALAGAPYVFAATAGIFTGVPNALLTSIILRLVGLKEISTANGLASFFSGIGVFSGPPIAGLLYENTRDYKNSFMLSGAILLAGSALALISWLYARRYTEKAINLSEVEVQPRDQTEPMIKG